MTENNNSFKKTFNDNESQNLYFVSFDHSYRSIDGVYYTPERFFNSGLYNIREVMFIPVDKRIVTNVWFTKEGAPPKIEVNT